MGHYLNFDKHQVWDLTLPQLNYYLKKCNEHIEFTIKVQTMSLGSIYGGGGSETTDTNDNDSETEDGYKVATPEDMEWLSSIL